MADTNASIETYIDATTTNWVMQAQKNNWEENKKICSDIARLRSRNHMPQSEQEPSAH